MGSARLKDSCRIATWLRVLSPALQEVPTEADSLRSWDLSTDYKWAGQAWEGWRRWHIHVGYEVGSWLPPQQGGARRLPVSRTLGTELNLLQCSALSLTGKSRSLCWTL